MDTEKAQQVLDEMKNVRPEKLNGEAKRLFEAIMTIADERDMYKKQVNDAFDRGWIHKDKIRKKLEYAIEMEEFYRINEPDHILIPVYNEIIRFCKELLEG